MKQRISLGLDDFKKLVSGEIVETDEAEIILSDVGYDQMTKAVVEAVVEYRLSHLKETAKFRSEKTGEPHNFDYEHELGVVLGEPDPSKETFNFDDDYTAPATKKGAIFGSAVFVVLTLILGIVFIIGMFNN